MRLADGYLAAAATLKAGLRRYRAQPHELDWLSVAYNMVAMDLWDDEAWFELAAGQVRLARAHGTLSWLPFALDYLAEIHIQAGELSKAAALLMERERVDPGTERPPCPTSHCCSPRGAATRRPRRIWPRRWRVALGPGRGRGADLHGLRAGGAVQRPRQLRGRRRGGARCQRRR